MAKRKKISLKIRREVLEAQNNKCADCNKELTPKITHFDHIVPISEGGDNDSENTQALCSNCHSIKSHTEHKKRTLKRKIKTKEEGEKKDYRKSNPIIPPTDKKQVPNAEKISEKEYQRFLKMYDELTYAEAFIPARFNNYQAKKLAELFCQEEYSKKFKAFLKMYDELTYAEAFIPARFNKADAIDIAFNRLSLPKSSISLVYFGD